MIEAFLITWLRRDIDATKVAGTLFLMYFPEGNSGYPTYTAVDTRWSKKDLMEVLEDFVDHRLLERKKAGLKQETPEQRHRPEEWLCYLKAYDLRQQKLSHSKIDLLLFPKTGGDEKRGFTYCRKGAALVAKPPLLPRRDKRRVS
jgi:hypothetical protein